MARSAASLWRRQSVRLVELLVIRTLPNQIATVVATQSSARIVRVDDVCVTVSAHLCQRQHKTVKGH
jgi:hypothetical protein